MARTENDTWDLASSVGATATAVAASRATASHGPDPLLDDPWADPLVRAVGIDTFVKLIDGEIERTDDPLLNRQAMNEQITVRTRFFDDFFMQAANSGVRQAVILASGLDARAYRLGWPSGTVVYEVDQPQVIEFKTTTLDKLGAAPTAERRTVAVDLRHDWPAALREAGLNPAEPTAWSAEGLLPFLPPEAQDALLDNITLLSAPGSRLATENLPDASRSVPMMAERMREATERWREHGFDVEMTDLWYAGDRNDVVDYLNAHGWQATTTSAMELFAAQGLSLRSDDKEATFASLGYVTATRA